MTPLQKHQDDLAYAALLKESKRAQAAKDAVQKKEDAKAAKLQAKTPTAAAVVPVNATPAGKAGTTGKTTTSKTSDVSTAKKAVVIAKKK